MNIPLAIRPHPREIVYPESDGMPRADNAKQLDWITLLYSNLRILFRDRPQDVFVGANQLWYPVEGEPEIRKAPDVYVVFGRPQQHRGAFEKRAAEATLEAERQRRRADRLSEIADRLANGTATPEDLAELRELGLRTSP